MKFTVIPIHFPGEPKPKTLRDCILQFLIYSINYDTLHIDGSIQCKYGRYRSIEDTYYYCATRFDVTLEDVVKEIYSLYQDEVICAWFCTDIEKYIVWKRAPWSGNSFRRLSGSGSMNPDNYPIYKEWISYFDQVLGPEWKG